MIKQFENEFYKYSWEEIGSQIYSSTEQDVLLALNSDRPTWKDFLALISPAAAPYLDKMAAKSKQLSERRFGKTVQMYAPMYLSNECQNICTYCGFSLNNDIPRTTLNDKQILDEVKVIKEMGFDHILIVTGEANKTVGVAYMEHAIELIRPYFANISIEVQPLEQEDYTRLQKAGVYSVLVYQETYNVKNYKVYHPKGKKSNFDYRLDTPDRLGKAGIHKIGLGVLLGLEDWRIDSAFTGLHLEYLKKQYWKSRYSISFPRLRPASGDFQANIHMTERELTQLLCAYRLFDENLDLSISTRERAEYRDHIFKLGATSMSAGSKTEPGGYASDLEALEQFEIHDGRSPETMATIIKDAGYDPVWKDWDAVLA